MTNKEYIINSVYAPGVSTYGAEGQPGERGRAGYGIYYVPFDIDLSIHNEKDSAFNTVVNAIRSNNYISNIVTVQYFLTDRTYQVNDLFITKTGKLFRLKTIADDITFEACGSLMGANDIFKIENNSIYNSRGTNFIFHDNAFENDPVVNNDSFLYIKTDNNKLLKIINGDSEFEIQKYNTVESSDTQTNNSAININALNSKILIHNLHVNDADSDDIVAINVNNNNEKYYKVATFEDDDNVDVSFGDKIIITNKNSNLLNILAISNNLVSSEMWTSNDSIEIENSNIDKIYVIIASNSLNSIVSRIKIFKNSK